MKVTSERRGGVLIASVEGRVDSANARMFRKGVGEVTESGDSLVILDLSGLSYISSAGLRSMLLIAKGLKARGGNFAVCSMAKPVRDVFRIVGFDKIISIYESQDEALAFFSQ